MIVLVGGRAGEGKTTFSNMCIEFLNEKNKKGTILPFAKGVKDVARSMMWDGEKDDKGRKLLQVIGGAGRDYNIDTWVSATANSILTLPKSVDVIFVDDWRFPNELKFMRNSFDEVAAVRIWRRDEDCLLYGTPLWDDPSETSLPDEEEYYDVFVHNIGTLENLRNSAETFVKTQLLPFLD